MYRKKLNQKPNNTIKRRGFTLVEMVIVAPIVILVIGVFIFAIINMVGAVMASRGSNTLAYNIQQALSQIDQDVSASSGYLAVNNVSLHSPQGLKDDDLTNFHNVQGPGADATNGTMLILNTYATTTNPISSTRSYVYATDKPHACASTLVNQNAKITMNIIYFVKTVNDVSSLWRRVVAPSNYLIAGCSAPWQQPSCVPGYVNAFCKTQDIKLVDGVQAGGLVIDYLKNSTNPTSIPNAINSSLADSARQVALDSAGSVKATITAGKTIAGRDVSQTGTIRTANPNLTPLNLVTDGLVLNLDAGNVKSIKGRKSVINWNSWTVGTGGTSDYSANGTSNSRIIDTNPWGVSDIVWDSYGYDAGGPNGGWNSSSFPIDNTKMYRFTTWVRRKTIGDGPFYLGTSGGGASVLNRSDAAVNGNPYFSATGWWGNANQWYLVVGYVWPAGSGAGATMPGTGIYALDGTKVPAGSDFVWQPTTTTSIHRSYLFYSGNPATNQQWYQPRVDVVDGTEPTITELRNNAGNKWYDLSGRGNNGTMYGGVTYSSSNSGSLIFDGVDDYGTIPYSSNLSLSKFTLGAWAKPNGLQTASASIFSDSYPPNVNYTLNFATNTLSIVGGIYLGGWYNTNAATLTDGAWAYVVITYDGTNFSLYVNGSLVGTPTVMSINPSASGTPIRIGKRWDLPNYFKGSIANITLYNRSLTSAELTQNFNALADRYGL